MPLRRPLGTRFADGPPNGGGGVGATTGGAGVTLPPAGVCEWDGVGAEFGVGRSPPKVTKSVSEGLMSAYSAGGRFP
jgi:hypothetical protein